MQSVGDEGVGLDEHVRTLFVLDRHLVLRAPRALEEVGRRVCLGQLLLPSLPLLPLNPHRGGGGTEPTPTPPDRHLLGADEDARSDLLVELPHLLLVLLLLLALFPRPPPVHSCHLLQEVRPRLLVDLPGVLRHTDVEEDLEADARVPPQPRLRRPRILDWIRPPSPELRHTLVAEVEVLCAGPLGGGILQTLTV